MTNPSKSAECAKVIQLACSILKLSMQEAKTLLQDRKFSEVIYHDNDIADARMVIEFDSADLICVFDKDKICGGVAIFLKEQPDIIDYISYCRKRYIYNYLLQNWLIDDSTTIQIDYDNTEFSLYVLS